MKKIGLIVNPVAGLGGSVGLKGSDGRHIFEQAMALGAKPRSGERTATALKALLPYAEEFCLFTCPGPMGEESAIKAGLSPTVITPSGAGDTAFGTTTPADTIAAAKAMVEEGCDLIIFSGGDGTARNVCEAIGLTVPVIGIPAGVKIHSAVYATNPRNAGMLAAEFVQGKVRQYVDGEVMDIDEEAFRSGHVTARLYGYMKIPQSRGHLQGGKISSAGDPYAVDGICHTIVEEMVPGALYIIGPGSTTVPIMTIMGLPHTLLGVDLVKDGKLIANDVTEKQILEELEKVSEAYIVVTPIGGQACLFGRGNQQIGPQVLRRVGKANIKIAASRAKLQSFYGDCLLLDTGDEALDQEFCGYYRVTVAYKQQTVFRVGC